MTDSSSNHSRSSIGKPPPRLQISTGTLLLVPLGLIFGVYASRAIEVTGYMALPWALDHAVDLEWSLIAWGVPKWLVHPYISTFLYNTDSLAVLVAAGVLLAFVNSPIIDVAVISTACLMPVVEIYDQVTMFPNAEYSTTHLVGIYLRAFSLVLVCLALLIAGYIRLMKRRPDWGTAGKRNLVGSLTFAVLLITSYQLAKMLEW